MFLDGYKQLIISQFYSALPGTGLPVFSTLPKPIHLNLVSTTLFKAGIVANVYRVC
jgi:hypothetical protein